MKPSEEPNKNATHPQEASKNDELSALAAPSPIKKQIVDFGDFACVLRLKKSDAPTYHNVELEIGDGYQSFLVDNYNWSDLEAGRFDEQLAAALSKIEAAVDWQDREFFVIAIPKVASANPVADVGEALNICIPSPKNLIDLESFVTEHKKRTDAFAAACTVELNKGRESKALFRGYLMLEDPAKHFTHAGYVTMDSTRVSRLRSLTYEEESFVGQEHKKAVTKAGNVLITVSTQGEPFDRLYGGRDVRQGDYEYTSALLEFLRPNPQDGDGVLKHQAQASWRHATKPGMIGGERVRLLCTEEFAQGALRKLKEYFGDLKENKDSTGS